MWADTRIVWHIQKTVEGSVMHNSVIKYLWDVFAAPTLHLKLKQIWQIANVWDTVCSQDPPVMRGHVWRKTYLSQYVLSLLLLLHLLLKSRYFHFIFSTGDLHDASQLFLAFSICYVCCSISLGLDLGMMVSFFLWHWHYSLLIALLDIAALYLLLWLPSYCSGMFWTFNRLFKTHSALVWILICAWCPCINIP